MWKYIEITSGIISGPSRIAGSGVVRLDFANIGRRVFFVDAVEADGGRSGLHDSFNYHEAIIAAEETARTEGVPVHDLVAGGAA